jgi:hypothetical protein
MKQEDYSLENLLELNGERIVIDESLGLWVKFEVIRTKSRAQGIKYSLTLHNNNKRILGFDNSHEIEYGAKKGVSPKRTFDHMHYDENDRGRPYNYTTAGKLLEDFWKEVDKRIEALKENNNE